MSDAELESGERELIVLFLRWALFEAEHGRVSQEFRKLLPALQTYGRKRGDYFNRLNAIQAVQQAEDAGHRDDARFLEAARRVWNLQRREPTDQEVRKVRQWWEERRKFEHLVGHLVDDKRSSRKAGRPRKH